MPRRVAVVGSRYFRPLKAVTQYVMGLPADTVVISGGALGVDRWAIQIAKLRRLRWREHLVTQREWRQLGRKAGPIRNARIVSDCDTLVAFWDGASPGTGNAIKQARAAGKPVTVIRMDAVADKEGTPRWSSSSSP